MIVWVLTYARFWEKYSLGNVVNFVPGFVSCTKRFSDFILLITVGSMTWQQLYVTLMPFAPVGLPVYSLCAA